MADWRLKHLDWRDNIQHQLTAFFETTTGKSPAAAIPPVASKHSEDGPAPVKPAALP